VLPASERQVLSEGHPQPSKPGHDLKFGMLQVLLWRAKSVLCVTEDACVVEMVRRTASGRYARSCLRILRYI
jgi:hypothetical protein